MLFYNTTNDFVLICLLAGFSGAAILTTTLFHAMIPLPGVGALLMMPITSACVIIARKRVAAPLSGFGTRLLQQGVAFLLPGGSPLMHNPILFPLMVLDGLFLDAFSGFSSTRFHASPWKSGGLIFLSSTLSLLLQGGILYVALGPGSFFFQKGVSFFLLVFIGWHGVLRFGGGVVGWYVSERLPRGRV